MWIMISLFIANTIKMDSRMQSICIILVLTCLANVSGGKQNAQTRLRKDLFEEYDKYVRPVQNLDDTVQVHIDLAIFQLIDLNEPAQILTAKWYLKMEWTDQFLTWDQQQYENNTVLYTPADNVWLPDMTHTSSYDEKRPVLVVDRKVMVRISDTGRVSWDPMFILKSGCDIEVADFPFDEQICLMEMEQWYYSHHQVNYNLQKDQKDNESIESTQKHRFVTYAQPITISKDLHAIRHSLWDMTHQECFSDTSRESTEIKCKVHMRRKYKFYMVNMLLPLLVLIVIGSMCFFLPINDGARVGLSVTVLLSMTVYLTMIIDNLPVSSDGVPHLQKFISTSMVFLGFSTIACVSIIKMYNRSTGDPGTGSDEKAMIRKPPYILVFLFLRILNKICCYKYDTEWENYKKLRTGNKVDKEGEDDDRKNEAKMEEGSVDMFSDEEGSVDRNEVFRKVWIAMAVVLNRVCLYAYVICAGSMVIFAVSKAAR